MARIAIGGVSFAVALAAASVVATGQTAAVVQDVDDQFIRVDGKKNPELIPEWLAWQEAFSTLAIVDFEKSGFTRNLVLSEDERAKVVAEARLQRSRQDICIQTQERIAQAKLRPEAMKAAVDDARIDCRWSTLDARDRVLEALTPEARMSLEVFVLETKSHITSFVPKHEFDMWKRPQ